MRLKFLFGKNDKKTIGIIVNSFNKGGLEQTALNLYNGYRKKGYKVYILSAFNHAPLAKNLDDIRDIYIFNNNPENLIKFCYTHDINVLHYHYNTLMMRAVRQMGFKVIYTMHGVYTWFNQAEITAYKNRLESAHHVVAVSSYVKDYYIARTNATNVTSIPNGLNFSNLAQSPTDFSFTRENLGIDTNTKVIANIASFFPTKHQIGMIGVMEELIKTNPNTVLLLVGNIGTQAYYDAFSEQLNTSCAKDNIVHIPYIENKYIGEFLRQSVDVYCLASLQEGLGNATIEALYCQKPTVITDTGCARDVAHFPSVKVVAPAYPSITSFTQSDMDRISLEKTNPNTQEISDNLKNILDNLSQYNLLAKDTAQNLGLFTMDSMMDSYCNLL